jgi:thiol-disulfide isomerase/thioredoxin
MSFESGFRGTDVAGSGTRTPERIGKSVLDISLRAAAGGQLSLGQIGVGKAATVVVFTCNHCPYARAWHDRLQDVARDYADRVGFVQINSNDPTRYPKDSFEAMQARVAGGEFASPYLFDANQELARTFGATVTPHVFVVDANGTVVYQGAPDGYHGSPSLRDWNGRPGQWLREALDDVLAGRAVARPETEPVGCSMKWNAKNADLDRGPSDAEKW